MQGSADQSSLILVNKTCTATLFPHVFVCITWTNMDEKKSHLGCVCAVRGLHDREETWSDFSSSLKFLIWCNSFFSLKRKKKKELIFLIVEGYDFLWRGRNVGFFCSVQAEIHGERNHLDAQTSPHNISVDITRAINKAPYLR